MCARQGGRIKRSNEEAVEECKLSGIERWRWEKVEKGVRRDVGGGKHKSGNFASEAEIGQMEMRWRREDRAVRSSARGAPGGRQRRLRGCHGLIIWLFMQKAESPPIRVGDL